MILSNYAHSDSIGALAKAKASAQSKFLPLGKAKTATVDSRRTGSSYSYSYADLAACLEAVVPALSEAGIAIFQPTSVQDGVVTASTLLVHGDSGEWLSGDFAVKVVEASDARSVGSAATYARRYGLLAVLGYASSDEDDDGAGARGGDHDMPEPQQAKACPSCGTVGAIIKGAPQYGGGWVCWAKRGGCGAKFPEGTDPWSAEAPKSLTPRRKEAPREPQRAETAPIAQEQGVPTAQTEIVAPEASAAPTMATTGTMATYIPQAKLGASPLPTVASPGTGSITATTFSYLGVEHTTRGLTREQWRQSTALISRVDGKGGKGLSRVLLGKVLGVSAMDPACTRDNLTEAQGAEYLVRLEAVLAGYKPDAT